MIQIGQEELRATWRANLKVMDDFRGYTAAGYEPTSFDPDVPQTIVPARRGNRRRSRPMRKSK
jgi:hypothetical protein